VISGRHLTFELLQAGFVASGSANFHSFASKEERSCAPDSTGGAGNNRYFASKASAER
jgi:hypothetical protein